MNIATRFIGSSILEITTETDSSLIMTSVSCGMEAVSLIENLHSVIEDLEHYRINQNS
jgi:hypothetical protein